MITVPASPNKTGSGCSNASSAAVPGAPSPAPDWASAWSPRLPASHGGGRDVHRRSAGGARFTLWLPVADPEPSAVPVILFPACRVVLACIAAPSHSPGCGAPTGGTSKIERRVGPYSLLSPSPPPSGHTRTLPKARRSDAQVFFVGEDNLLVPAAVAMTSSGSGRGCQKS